MLLDKSWPTVARAHALRAVDDIAMQHDDVDAEPDLIRALHNGPPGLRAEAAALLGRRDKVDGNVVKHVYRRMQRDTDASVRAACATALGNFGDVDAAAPLFSSLDETDETARAAKIEAIRNIGYWAIAPGFVNSADTRVRSATIESLSGVCDEQAVSALTFAVSSGADADTRADAVKGVVASVKACRAIQKKETVDAMMATLNAATRDEAPAVRAAARAALSALADAGGGR